MSADVKTSTATVASNGGGDAILKTDKCTIRFGGLGSIVGSVLGAVLLTVLPEALRGFAEYRMVIYSVLLIILMITRPQGLLGKTGSFKGWRRNRTKSRTEAEEITAEDTRDNPSVEKATLGERQRDTSLGEEKPR